MLRAIFRRRFKDGTSGIELENQLFTIDFENADIENQLKAGGFSESGFEVRELLGVEVFDKPMPVQCDPPPVRDYKDRHDKPTQVDPPPPPRNHPYVETPLKGKDAKVSLVTLLDGPFVNQTACVYVEFADGLCIAEISLGATNVLGVVDRKQVRFWE